MLSAKQHELKLLNLGLVAYVCAGALLFHSLGDFDEQTAAPLNVVASPASQQEANKEIANGANSFLDELRLDSVRRMWNITNRLNILYESNWTELVLAELVEFERKFVESLERAAAAANEEAAGEAADEDEDERKPREKKKEDEIGDKKRQQQAAKASNAAEPKSEKSTGGDAKRLARARLKSIKRALVHSLATITTMGSPIKPPQSKLGKVATILYGAAGIPLLLVTLAKSGRQLASSSHNLLLIARHYCFSLPAYYLCCCCGLRCNLLQCLKWLSCCCCCCCCSYLFCPKTNSGKQARSSATGRPRLRLKPTGGATAAANRTPPAPPQPDGLFLVETKTSDEQNFDWQTQPLEGEKTVRFQGTGNKISSAGNGVSGGDLYEGNGAEDEPSSGVFATSVALLIGYLSIGSLYYSHARDLPLLDAFFECFSMLATSNLASSFDLDNLRNFDQTSGRRKLADFYESVQRKRVAAAANQSASGFVGANRKVVSGAASHSFESIARDSLFLLVGLNLVSTCAHLAKLWLKRRAKFRSAPATCLPASACNGGPSLGGQLESLGGSFGGGGGQAGQSAAQNFAGRSPQSHSSDTQFAQFELAAVQQPLEENRVKYVQLGADGQQQQLDLANLILVGGSPPQQLSENSYASDRSSGVRSLCAQHQHQLQHYQPVAVAAATLGRPNYTSESLLRNSRSLRDMPLGGATGVGARRASATENGEQDEIESDEMELMLRACLRDSNPTKPTRLSSSSSRLSSVGAGQPLGANKRLQSNAARVEARPQQAQVRAVQEAVASSCWQHSNEADSSPNTVDTLNSRTISSQSSRATQHSNQNCNSMASFAPNRNRNNRDALFGREEQLDETQNSIGFVLAPLNLQPQNN